MSQEEAGLDKDAVKREFDFFLKDYELKTRYLSDHLQRMWTRFNFFVTILSALISGKFLFQSNVPNRELIYAGLVLSAVWYLFGAQDRFLVEVYRTQAQEAGGLAHEKTKSDKSYLPIGEIHLTTKTLRQKQKPWIRSAVGAWKRLALHDWPRLCLSSFSFYGYCCWLIRIAARHDMRQMIYWGLQSRVSTKPSQFDSAYFQRETTHDLD